MRLRKSMRAAFDACKDYPELAKLLMLELQRAHNFRDMLNQGELDKLKIQAYRLDKANKDLQELQAQFTALYESLKSAKPYAYVLLDRNGVQWFQGTEKGCGEHLNWMVQNGKVQNMLELAMYKIRPLYLDTTGIDPQRQCKGLPRAGCNYLSGCDTVCNKCGKVHSVNSLP